MAGRIKTRRILMIGLTVTAVLVISGCAASSRVIESEFARSTVDVGIVAADAEKSVEFYKALGFIEIQGFSLSSQKGGDTGLSAYRAFDIRILVPSEQTNATKIKITEFPKVRSEKVDNEFIHSSLGYSFLTMFVKDITAALERAKTAGAVFVKEKPYQLAENKYLALIKDPDGNIIELIGPKK